MPIHQEPPCYLAATSFEPSQPPFIFEDVASRVFPLRADPDRLIRFCDDYINIVPREISYCRPVLPYVFLAILSYGRMASREQAAGWVAQNEVFFSIPVAWHHCDESGREVVELASVTPYLFVDENLSLVTGREVYGWPKIRAWFEPDIETWTEDVVGRPRTLRMDTLLFPRAYAGRRPQRRTLLEIEPDPLGDPFAWPPRFDFPGNPLWMMPQALKEGFRLAMDGLRTTDLRPEWQRLLPSPGELTGSLAGGLVGDLSEVVQLERWISSTLHIKQFPDVRTVGGAAYQALVSAPMNAVGLRGSGLLGTPPTLRGDASGGFRIRLHRAPELDIAESLGLETTASHTVEDPVDVHRGWTRGPRGKVYLAPLERGDAPRRRPELRIDEMRPVFPYWTDLDLEYGCGRTETWRTPCTDWSHGASPGARTNEPLPLNHAGGGILTSLQGPFLFPDVTVRVLLLKADEAKLQKLLDDTLNAVQNLWCFRPSIDYVQLMSLSYGITESESNDVGWWADREVGFWLMLEGEDIKTKEKEIFLTAPFLFTNSLIGSLTLRETFGMPQIYGEIRSPGNPWMEQDGPAADEPLLQLRTDVFQALQTGQRSHRRVLLEVIQTEEGSAPPSPPTPPTPPTPTDPFAFELPEHARTIFLKQFRDAERPELSGYQALVLGQTRFSRAQPEKLPADRLEVRLHRYPSHPIVRRLGLLAGEHHTERRASREPGRVWEGRPVDVLRPDAAFWLTTTMEAGYGDEEIRLFPEESC